jgi:hypothetical protein
LVFEIEGMTPSAVTLTVTHDDVEPDGEMLQGGDGWVGVLSHLKSLLETGWTVSEPARRLRRDPGLRVRNEITLW